MHKYTFCMRNDNHYKKIFFDLGNKHYLPARKTMN